VSDAKTVGISDMKIIRGQGTLVTYALGSCIGICLYDATLKLAAMIHVLLPNIPEAGDVNVFKYADSAIAETLRKMEVFGASRTRLVAKIAGGAKMFSIPGDSDFGNIGQRNIEAVTHALRKEGITIKAQEVGGTIARTLFFDAETGEASVKSMGQGEKKI
jgi:chemotaxis protein CheD